MKLTFRERPTREGKATKGAGSQGSPECQNSPSRAPASSQLPPAAHHTASDAGPSELPRTVALRSLRVDIPKYGPPPLGPDLGRPQSPPRPHEPPPTPQRAGVLPHQLQETPSSEDGGPAHRHGLIGALFLGWSIPRTRNDGARPTEEAQTFPLRIAWQRHGLIHPSETPLAGPNGPRNDSSGSGQTANHDPLAGRCLRVEVAKAAQLRSEASEVRSQLDLCGVRLTLALMDPSCLMCVHWLVVGRSAAPRRNG